MLKSKLFFYTIAFVLVGFLSIEFVGAQDRSEIDIVDPTNIVPRQYQILEVSITGLQTARESFILSSSGFRVGNNITIPGEEISEAIKQLYRTSLFSNVEINYEPVSGGVNIEIVVQEEPRLDSYEIEGVRRSHRRDLRDRISLLSGFSVTESSRAQAISTIKRYYSEQGYWGTEVTIDQEITDEARNRVKLTFNVDRGERIKVREINFAGNESFSDRRLRKAFDTIKQDRWWRIFKRHVYTEEEFQEGIDNLHQFYRDNGFLDIRILQDTVYVDNWRRSKDGVFFDFTIEEGEQYKVRNVIWEGNTVYSNEELTRALGFEKGDVFNESQYNRNLTYRQDEGDIQSLYENIGYLFFRANDNIRVVGQDSLDLEFDIIENDIATIRRVSFSGNTKTHDNVVRRNLRTVPGSTYNRSNIIRTIRELGQLGYFSPEGVIPDLEPNQVDRTVDVSYSLDETQGTDNFELSGGFGGQGIGVILAARVNFNNFSVQRMFESGGWNPIPSGDGQKLSLGVQVTGQGYQSYNFSFTEPWLRGRPNSLGVSLSYDIINFRQNRFSQFGGGSSMGRERNELFSASVSLGRRLSWPDDYFSQRSTLTFNHYNTAGLDQVFEGRSNLLTFRQEIERNSTNNPISPTAGSKFSVSGEAALPLPDFAQFYKLKTSYQHHSTIIGKLVLSSTAEYGYMGYFTESNQTNFQRFFIGGTQLQQRQAFLNDNIDLRGFPGGFTGVISPLDDNRNLIGGRVYNKYSFELRYPAVQSEQLQLIPYIFFDAGNTFNSMGEFDPFEVKRALGFGSRIFLPILGLVDLSYGYRLDGTPSSVRGAGLEPGSWQFLFNIGAPF